MKTKFGLLLLSTLLLIAASVPIFQKPDIVPTQDDTLVITDDPLHNPVLSRVSVSNLAKVLVLDASNTVAGVFPPARLGTGTPDNSTFLRGDGQFTAIPGGGDMLKSIYDANTDGRIDLASGGTGANTASGARTALGLVIGVDVEAHDTTISKLGATIEESELSLADNTTNNASTVRHGFTPKLPGNTTTFLRGDGTFATPSGSGDMLRSTYDPDTDGTIAVAQGGTGGTTSAAARSNLGLVPGTDVQSFDQELAAWAGLTSAADTLGYFTGSGTASTTPLTSFARTILDDANAAAVRSTIGAGTGNGTVTSVGITAPSQFSVSGNPLTTAGSIALTWTGRGTNLNNLAQNVTVDGSGNIATAGTISGILNGSQIESGTVGASYIDSAIARLDSPLFTNGITISRPIINHNAHRSPVFQIIQSNLMDETFYEGMGVMGVEHSFRIQAGDAGTDYFSDGEGHHGSWTSWRNMAGFNKQTNGWHVYMTQPSWPVHGGQLLWIPLRTNASPMDAEFEGEYISFGTNVGAASIALRIQGTYPNLQFTDKNADTSRKTATLIYSDGTLLYKTSREDHGFPVSAHSWDWEGTARHEGVDAREVFYQSGNTTGDRRWQLDTEADGDVAVTFDTDNASTQTPVLTLHRSGQTMTSLDLHGAELDNVAGIDLPAGGTNDLVGLTQSTNVLADSITDTAGTGAPNFPNGITLGGETRTSWPTGSTNFFSLAWTNIPSTVVDLAGRSVQSKTVNTDTTLTFSGTPVLGQWQHVVVTNSDSSAHTLSFPTAYNVRTGGNATSISMPASSVVWLTFSYDGTKWFVGANSSDSVFGASTFTGAITAASGVFTNGLTVGATNVVSELAGKQPLDSDVTTYASRPGAWTSVTLDGTNAVIDLASAVPGVDKNFYYSLSTSNFIVFSNIIAGAQGTIWINAAGTAREVNFSASYDNFSTNDFAPPFSVTNRAIVAFKVGWGTDATNVMLGIKRK